MKKPQTFALASILSFGIVVSHLSCGIAPLQAEPAPIDSKTEHLGLKLGSLRSELKYPVIREEVSECRKLPESFQNKREDAEKLKAMQTKVRVQIPNAVYGDVIIERITLYYVADRLCEIVMNTYRDQSDLPKNMAMTWEQHEQTKDVLLAALTSKYGKPTRTLGEQKTFFGAWIGSDVYLLFLLQYGGEYRSFFSGCIEQGLVLGSHKALEAAYQDLMNQFISREGETKRKAQDPKLKDKI